MAKLTKTYKTKAVSPIVTIPSGKTQRDEFQMDSPVIETYNLSDLDGEGVTINVLYTYSQGSIEQKRMVSTRLSFPEVIEIIGQETFDSTLGSMVQVTEQLIQNLPEHQDIIEEI